MKKIVAACLAALLCFSLPTVLHAQDSPFNFLRLVSGARASALSGAVVSIPGDISMVYYNPALVNTLGKNNFNASFLKHVLDINSGTVSYSPELEIDGTLAASVGFNSNGSFNYYDKQGNEGGTFSANDLAFGVSYANKLDTNLHYGVTAKYIHVSIEEYSTSALAFDLGLFYEIPDKRTNIGFSILHLGTQFGKISEEGESLPIDARIGVNHRLKGLPLLVNFSFHHLADEVDGFFDRFKGFAIGGEFYFGEYIEVRLGYNNKVRNLTHADAESGLTGLSGGLGIKTDVLNFDYGYSKYGSAVDLHRFSIGLEI